MRYELFIDQFFYATIPISDRGHHYEARKLVNKDIADKYKLEDSDDFWEYPDKDDNRSILNIDGLPPINIEIRPSSHSDT